MRVAIIRTMTNRSIDVVSDNLVAELKKNNPNWEIIELFPQQYDVNHPSLFVRFLKYYERYWRYPSFVAQQAADIYHIIEPRDAHIAYWLKKKGRPIVVTCHDITNMYDKENLKNSLQVPFVSSNAWEYSIKGMKVASHIISVSSATAHDTSNILNIQPELITVIPNAVEAIFQPLPMDKASHIRQALGASDEFFCLLNVGSNDPRKNISMILQVVEILAKKELAFQFWKVGEDFTIEQKKFIESHHISEYVKYLGEPDKQTLVQIYNAANILIAPSLFEGFGITILESMACGTPVITSNVSAMPEVAGDAGLLVDPRNSYEIVDAVLRLCQDSNDYREFVQRGITRAKSFTWGKTSEQVEKVYKKVLGQPAKII